MADVQLERGHIRIANRLVEAVLAADFSITQHRILLALIRLTYGWRRTEVAISTAELAARLRLDATSGFYRAWRELIAEGVVIVNDAGGGAHAHTVGIQKDFERWGIFTVGEALLARLWDDGATRSARRAKDTAHRPTLSPRRGEVQPRRRPARAATLSPTGEKPVSPTGAEGVSPTGGEGTGSKCDGVVQLDPPKDSERQERQVPDANASGRRASARAGRSGAKPARPRPSVREGTKPSTAVVPEPDFLALHAHWVATRGAVNYGALRGALNPVWPALAAEHGAALVDRLRESITVFSEIADVQPERERKFYTCRKWAEDVHRYLRLGALPTMDGFGMPTERGALTIDPSVFPSDYRRSA